MIKRWLKPYLDDPRKIFKLFATGAVLFFIGLATIVWAEKMIPPSLQQEVAALAGTAVGGLGFFTAMMAQLMLIIQRLTSGTRS